MQGEAGILGLHSLHLLQAAADAGLGAEQVGLVLVEAGQGITDGLCAQGIRAGGLRRSREGLRQRLKGLEQALRRGGADSETVARRRGADDGHGDGRGVAGGQADAHAGSEAAAGDRAGGERAAVAAGHGVGHRPTAAAETDLVLRAVDLQGLLGQGGVVDGAGPGGGAAGVAAGGVHAEGAVARACIHEQRVAGVADGGVQIRAERELVLPAIALVLHAAIRLNDEGLGAALAAGEKIVALAVLGVGVLRELLHIALHGGRGVLQVLRADGAVIHLHRELPRLADQSGDALQRSAFELQRVLRVLSVLRVAGQAVDLPGEGDVLRRGDRLV